MTKKLLTLIFTALFIIGIASALTACNTFEGAGKDIERGGKAIKDEANESK